MNRYSRKQGIKVDNFLVRPYRATRCIGYSGLLLLDNWLVHHIVSWKLLILVQYTSS